MTSFTRNEKAIRTVYNAGSIKTTGFHKGFFTKAILRKSKSSDAEAIELSFLSTKGESGTITIWYQSAKGEELARGMSTIQGLMALLEIENLKEKKNDLVEVFNWDSKQVESVRMTTFPDLLNKPIGTVWQVEEYIKQVKQDDGSYANSNPIELKERAVFQTFCDAETKQTAIEILDDTEAQDIDKMLDRMEPVKRVNLPKAQLSQAKDTASTKRAEEWVDSEIPF
jgi:flagellin-specific chaperone FliS